MKDLIKQILMEEKKKLFVPRNIDERHIEFEKKVKDTSDKFLIDNNIKSLEYYIDIDVLIYDIDYSDIENNIILDSVIKLNDGKSLTGEFFRKIKSPNRDYTRTISYYLNYLISQHNPKDRVVSNLSIMIYCEVGKIKMKFNFEIEERSGYKLSLKKEINFSKTL